MPFCPKCGRQVPEDAKICDSCGYNLESAKRILYKAVSLTSQNKLQKNISEVDSGASQKSQPKSMSPKKVILKLFIWNFLIVSLIVHYFTIGVMFASFYDISFKILVSFSAIILSLIITYIWGALNRCPSCKKIFARDKIGKEFLDSDEGYETVIRYDDVYNNKGERIGQVEREEQVHVIYKTYLFKYKCKFCGFKWKQVETIRHEG
ncbi:MAG: zinc ribbon domain-containing protein [Candidatus Methanomethylicia archaeon]